MSQAKLLTSQEIHKPVWKAAYSAQSSTFYVVHAKEKNSAITIYNRQENGTVKEGASIHLPDIYGTCKVVRVSTSGTILGCLIGKSLLYCNLTKDPLEMLHYEHEVTLISLAISPSDDVVSTGDIVGKLSLWRINESSKPTKSTYHWHAHALECLAYHPEAAILYSGGHEGVLVLWHENANERTYVSKLPAKLASLSMSKDGTLICICLANNSIKVFK